MFSWMLFLDIPGRTLIPGIRRKKEENHLVMVLWVQIFLYIFVAVCGHNDVQ